MKVNKILILLMILAIFILTCCMCKENNYLYEGLQDINDSNNDSNSNKMNYDPNVEPDDSNPTDLSPSFNNTIGNSNNSSVYYPNQGISKSDIPKGQEDLYILKSEVVPPVCPVCPSLSVQQSMLDKKKCPPCPACARCPEPGYECKLVAAPSNNPSSFPKPILNDFSTFGA